ncbi:hypothetical protein EWM64_g5185 [Hericium alpestre]|uniref:Uncharacterized protein n=1 Tax=Hericium alpestre TaxID=135208 RepID=A0A4Y9ZVA1_9AGAM|nr:hypothetical protein EWM64_g5185 [Hericium alpestre]
MSHGSHGVTHGSHGAMQSKVGNPQVYESGDQKTSHGSTDAPIHPVGHKSDNAQLLEAKDEEEVWDEELDAAEKKGKEDWKAKKFVQEPMEPALEHGNKPSRGAEVDAKIRQEELDYLRSKGKSTL